MGQIHELAVNANAYKKNPDGYPGSIPEALQTIPSTTKSADRVAETSAAHVTELLAPATAHTATA